MAEKRSQNFHDHYFRRVFGEVENAQAYLHYYLPKDVTANLDLTSLALQPGTFVDEELRDHLTDLLYRVLHRTGEEKYLYFLFEHKSYPDPLVQIQILRYMLRIWEQLLSDGAKPPLTPIFGIVVYHGRQAWGISTEFHGLIDVEQEWNAYVPNFKYHLHDLTKLAPEEVVGPLMLRAALQILKHVFDPDLAQQLPKVLAYFSELIYQRDILDFVAATLRYISGASPYIEREQIETLVLNTFPNNGGSIMQTAAQSWIDEGIEKGREEGILEMLHESITDGLNLRFAEDGLNLYNNTLKNINDIAILRTILTLLFQAESLDEIQQVYDDYAAQQDEAADNLLEDDDETTDDPSDQETSEEPKGVAHDE